MASKVDGSTAYESSNNSWLELLPARELFDCLRKGCGGGNVCMCTVGGNFFIWNQLSDSFCDGEVLTLNLNRVFASPESNIFQVTI